MTPQAGCSPDRCFGTADSRRRLRGGSLASLLSVQSFSCFSFHWSRIGVGDLFVVFRSYFQNTFSFRERFCHKSQKAKNLQECFCTLFSRKSAFWPFF